MKAHEIKKALSERHTQDYFLTEPSCGPGGSQRFDAYAIKKSWVHLKYSGYEIKVSRADFLQDDKWRGYLPLCNEFWWVCPKGLIKKEEIPEDCGLIYVYPETFAMRKIKKAKFREIDHPVEILLYALMWKEKSNKYPFFNSKAEFFKAWLTHKNFNHYLGHNVSKAIKKRVSELVCVKENNERLEKEMEAFKELKKLLREEGLYFYDDESMLKAFRERLRATTSPKFKEAIKTLKRSTDALSELLGEDKNE